MSSKEIVKLIKLLAVLLSVSFAISGSIMAFAAETPENQNAVQNPISTSSSSQDNSYYSYYLKYCNDNKPEQAIVMNGDQITASDNNTKALSTVDGEKCTVINTDNKWSEWTVNVNETGTYSLYLDYFPLPGTGKDIQLAVSIDGNEPYSEADNITVPRIWQNQSNINGHKILQDDFGNDLSSPLVENPHWTTSPLSDIRGMYAQPYLFHFESGQHTIRITIKSENIAIDKIQLGNSETIPSYSQYLSLHSNDTQVKGNVVRLEAEDTYETNNSMLFPTSDGSNIATLPSDPYRVRLNTIGQMNWSNPGQSISWKVDVPEDGLYQIAFRARQNYNLGMNSYRTLYINGKVPFQEAQDITFPYNSDWYMKTLGDNKPQLVYLKKGDIITLEVSSGKLSEPLRNVNQAILDINNIYRQVIIITGTTPDIYRDYALEKQIPDLIGSLSKEEKFLEQTSKSVVELTGKTGTQSSTLDQFAQMLNDFINDPNSIPARLDSFKGNIESLGSLLLSFGQQPLELDCIDFIPVGDKVPKVNDSFIDNVKFSLEKFFASFFINYNSLSKESGSKKSVNVWITTGRDQAQILNNMIHSSFTANTKIPINLSLVDTGALLIQASLAGRGPDVALMVPTTTPVNLAMRGALVDLSQPEFKLDNNFKNMFFPSAWTPFYYNGGLYAIPDVQNFNMLFYRTDIFSELNIQPPQTWDDFYKVLAVLQNDNLEVGIPEIDSANPGVSLGISTFNSFLFQNGGTYYNSKLSKTLFDQNVEYNAFKQWVDLYSKYGLDRSFDFFNRFRSGEMPMAIMNFTSYNQLTAAAPEIAGLWQMVPIPGTMKSNGTIDRSESSQGSGCIMLKSAQDKHIEQEAFSFMSWWVSTDTQKQYGNDLEATVGVAARYATANIDAFKQLGWTNTEITNLLDQWKWVKNVNEIPGNYLIQRDLTNAFRATVDNNLEPNRELSIYNKDINDEIARKRKEFKLN